MHWGAGRASGALTALGYADQIKMALTRPCKPSATLTRPSALTRLCLPLLVARPDQDGSKAEAEQLALEEFLSPQKGFLGSTSWLPSMFPIQERIQLLVGEPDPTCCTWDRHSQIKTFVFFEKNKKQKKQPRQLSLTSDPMPVGLLVQVGMREKRLRWSLADQGVSPSMIRRQAAAGSSQLCLSLAIPSSPISPETSLLERNENQQLPQGVSRGV